MLPVSVGSGITAAFTLLTFVLVQLMRQGHTLGCYKCQSVNGSLKNCEDPFNSIDQLYMKECLAPRPGRQGLFPGTQCLKMKFCDSSKCTWIRGCVADNGGMNSDNEIGRVDHCSLIPTEIVYDQQKVYGCITSCKADGCNEAFRQHPQQYLLLVGVIFVYFRLRS